MYLSRLRSGAIVENASETTTYLDANPPLRKAFIALAGHILRESPGLAAPVCRLRGANGVGPFTSSR